MRVECKTIDKGLIFMRTGLMTLLIGLPAVSGVHAQDTGDTAAGDMEEVLVTGGRTRIPEIPGSAHMLDKSDLEQFDYTDINRVLREVPGVYIREEDGYGLRPNIGIRGAAPERSQKITLMEDGILIAPATYSAPAAYYFPNVNRMQAVEVFKGPASIQYGPHTVGGVINLVSRPVVDGMGNEVDVSGGSDGYYKLRAFHGDNRETFGYWVEGFTYGSDGYKQLDGGGDTGFERTDVNARMQFRFGESQTLDIKVGHAAETSDETYLGLTDADFQADPDRRYRASQLDRFESEHNQVHLIHDVELSDDWSLNTKVYVNRFDRDWNKFDGFIDGPAAEDVLRYPDIFVREMALLRGGIDSNPTDDDAVDVTSNDREYGAQGAEMKSDYGFDLGEWRHTLTVGGRYHHDYVEREHRVRGYWMQDGNLVFDGVDDRPDKVRNRGETDAYALYVYDTAELDAWKVNAGVRYERIEGRLVDYQADEENSQVTEVVTPGAGVFYQLTDALGLLAGVHAGFSPNAPGLSDEAEPEESTNYEYGLRYTKDTWQVEAIGFFSDYSNLLGRCRVADSGCTVGEEFNGGAVEIAGTEVTAEFNPTVGELTLPVALSYTHTESAFQSGFQSSFSQWGRVRKGDELPYLPADQLRLQFGVRAARWDLTAGVSHVGEMREEPGQGDIDTTEHTEALTTLDLAGTWYFSDAVQLQLTADNVTDEREIVSRRPFGARPNKPLTVVGTLKLHF